MFVQIVDDTYVRLLSSVGSGIVWAVANFLGYIERFFYVTCLYVGFAVGSDIVGEVSYDEHGS